MNKDDQNNQNLCNDDIFFDYNMRIKQSIYLRYRQLQFLCTLLQLAAYYGSEKCFSFLLENGADPTIEDDNGLNVVAQIKSFYKSKNLDFHSILVPFH